MSKTEILKETLQVLPLADLLALKSEVEKQTWTYKYGGHSTPTNDIPTFERPPERIEKLMSIEAHVQSELDSRIAAALELL